MVFGVFLGFQLQTKTSICLASLANSPLAPNYPHNSPYAFSENRVIDAVELEGGEALLIHGDARAILGFGLNTAAGFGIDGTGLSAFFTSGGSFGLAAGAGVGGGVTWFQSAKGEELRGKGVSGGYFLSIPFVPTLISEVTEDMVKGEDGSNKFGTTFAGGKGLGGGAFTDMTYTFLGKVTYEQMASALGLDSGEEAFNYVKSKSLDHLTQQIKERELQIDEIQKNMDENTTQNEAVVLPKVQKELKELQKEVDMLKEMKKQVEENLVYEGDDKKDSNDSSAGAGGEW
jgi:hypothetical protein